MLNLKYKGFTLFEVMLSAFLLSLVMLAILTEKQSTSRDARAIHYFAQAQSHMENMSRFLRAHRGDNSAYLSTWRKQIQSTLPDANGVVSANNTKYKIIITWGGLAANDCTSTKTGTRGCMIDNMALP